MEKPLTCAVTQLTQAEAAIKSWPTLPFIQQSQNLSLKDSAEASRFIVSDSSEALGCIMNTKNTVISNIPDSQLLENAK